MNNIKVVQLERNKRHEKAFLGKPLSLPTRRLVVTATDRGSPRLAGSATLTVIIIDQNDNSPTIPLPKEVRIPESKCFICRDLG